MGEKQLSRNATRELGFPTRNGQATRLAETTAASKVSKYNDLSRSGAQTRAFVARRILVGRKKRWEVQFRHERAEIRDTKGMRHLAWLLAHPYRQFSGTDLERNTQGVPKGTLADADKSRAAPITRSTESPADNDASWGDGESRGMSTRDVESSLPMFDKETYRIMRARIRDITQELDHLQRHGGGDTVLDNVIRIEELKRERTDIQDYLKAGRRQPSSSKNPDARLAVDPVRNVHERVWNSIKRIIATLTKAGSLTPQLGKHLKRYVNRRGDFSYTPPEGRFSWDVEGLGAFPDNAENVARGSKALALKK